MSSQYPIMDNRPIDQWKVTELREELRRRRLTIKGLKEDLVKRLDEAIQNERELLKEKELGNGFDPDSKPEHKCEEEEPNPVKSGQVAENANEVIADEIKEVVSDVIIVDTNNSTPDVGLGAHVQHEAAMDVTNLAGVVDETAAPAVSAENSVPGRSSVLSKSEPSSQDSRYDEKNQDSESPTADITCDLLEPNNQVSEVSPDLGFQVKCESISTDSLSINEKNELKDNLNADNFHLDLEVVKTEMVQPSSSDVAPFGDDLHLLDIDQEPGDNCGSVEERDDVTNPTDVDLSKKSDIADLGSPEKLNLDRSSGDESMEEDVTESKQIESNDNFDELGDMREVHELHVVKEGTPLEAAVGGLSPDKKVIVVEENRLVVTAEKRKLEEQESVGTTEPVKRLRRWNVETLKASEPQAFNLTSSGTSKDTFEPTPRRTFTRSDSGLSGGSPKERIVPPSQRTATASLRIDRFLRPFTLKAVQELLAKTGTVCSFWMDHIKTHCYVAYSSVEEAIATRNALYNLQWPPNGGRLLIADFVDPQEVKTHVEAPPQSPAPISARPTTPSTPFLQQPQASRPPLHQHNLTQKLPPPPLLPPPPPLSNPPPAGERLPLPLPTKKPEPPILTLDDLFRKTRATPRIYYSPLSEKQVAAKLAPRHKTTRE